MYVNRYDTGRYRLPECLCLVSRRPFFGLFHGVLAIAQALRLLHPPDNGTIDIDATPPSLPHAAPRLEALLYELLAGRGGERGGVPGPGKEMGACGHRFVRPVDELMSLDGVALTPLLVSHAPMSCVCVMIQC